MDISGYMVIHVQEQIQVYSKKHTAQLRIWVWTVLWACCHVPYVPIGFGSLSFGLQANLVLYFFDNTMSTLFQLHVERMSHSW